VLNVIGLVDALVGFVTAKQPVLLGGSSGGADQQGALAPSPPIAKLLSRTRNVTSVSQVATSVASG
jgi:hypothetical protein